jgi:hypothetical protein
VSGFASSPEDLELLLEDALVLRDDVAAAALFEDGGVLIERAGGVRGPSHVARLLTERGYLASPSSVTVIRDIAVVVGPRTVNISRRHPHGGWRMVAAILTSAAP